ncbi:four-helix bundle copper-binding protein [Sorangium sp. So ce233]|uniref:four-helix bundle copper-binding protein n=1 Tax=Sorangium sp. So ce233 TaxID=3133290 RepID=UPI003F5FD571
MVSRSTMNQVIEACIKACLECHQVCTEMVMHCLKQGGEHAEPSHIQTMLDCAEICQTSGHFMLRRSPLHSRTCEVCAEACERRASECERFDDERMKACADACRACAQACRNAAPIALAA